MSSITRIGFLGCSNIAQDFATAMSYLPHEVKGVACAARSLDAAKTFASKFNVDRAYGSYEELVKDPEVDVIYVSVLHPWHYPTALLCLKNGKSILLEKPLTMNAPQLEHLIEVARENNAFFMEGMWTRYFPYVIKLRELLRSGVIGDVKLFQANFCLSPAPDVARVNDPKLGGGALLDIGIYTMAFSQMVFNGDYPEKVTAQANMNSQGADEMTLIVLDHGEGRKSVQTLSMMSPAENHAIISGTKGYIKVEAPFNCSTGFVVVTENDGKKESKVYDYPLPEIKSGTSFIFPNGVGMVHEVSYLHKLIQEKKKESDKQSLKESLDIMKILDQVRKEIGLVYPAETEKLLS